eukprot:7400877-Pyramimonas_sp.AAC.1
MVPEMRYVFFLPTRLLLISSGRRVGLYCSDVSRAFDRVKSERLVSKLRFFGLPIRFAMFLPAGWRLAPLASLSQ